MKCVQEEPRPFGALFFDNYFFISETGIQQCVTLGSVLFALSIDDKVNKQSFIAELLLSRETRRTLAQLRTNKSPLLVSYLFSIGDPRHPSPLCPLCLMHDHTSSHLFECKSLPTSLSSLDLWTNPDKVEPFLATWGERLLAATWFRVLDSAGSTLVEWGRQQQQQQTKFSTFTSFRPTSTHFFPRASSMSYPPSSPSSWSESSIIEHHACKCDYFFNCETIIGWKVDS